MTDGDPVERNVPVEDRLEQAEPVPDRPEVPEADALEQAQEVEPGPRPREPALGFEVPEADAWDQAIEVPIDDDWGA